MQQLVQGTVRTRIRRVRRKSYGGMSYAKAEIYGAILMRAINSHFSGAVFFTREDLVQLPTFSHISTTSRCTTVGSVVRFLLDNGQLVLKKRTDLCLPTHVRHYNEEPLQRQYYDRVAALIRSMPRGELVTVMDVVAAWRTDPHLTVNNKRVAVRGCLPRLIKDGHLKRQDEFQYSATGR